MHGLFFTVIAWKSHRWTVTFTSKRPSIDLPEAGGIILGRVTGIAKKARLRNGDVGGAIPGSKIQDMDCAYSR